MLWMFEVLPNFLSDLKVQSHPWVLVLCHLRQPCQLSPDWLIHCIWFRLDITPVTSDCKSWLQALWLTLSKISATWQAQSRTQWLPEHRSSDENWLQAALSERKTRAAVIFYISKLCSNDITTNNCIVMVLGKWSDAKCGFLFCWLDHFVICVILNYWISAAPALTVRNVTLHLAKIRNSLLIEDMQNVLINDFCIEPP